MQKMSLYPFIQNPKGESIRRRLNDRLYLLLKQSRYAPVRRSLIQHRLRRVRLHYRRVGFGMSVLRLRLEVDSGVLNTTSYRMTVADLLDFLKMADPNSMVFAEDGFISIVPVVEE